MARRPANDTDAVFSQPLPHNMEAERSLLGGLLREGARIPDIKLSPEDFYDGQHQLIYRLMLSLEAVDLVTVTEAVISSGADVKPSYLVELFDAVPNAQNVRHYAKIIRDKATRRRIIFLGMELQQRGYDRTDPAPWEAAQRIMAEVDNLGAGEAEDAVPVGDVLGAVMDRLQEARDNPGAVMGIPSGLPRLDKHTGGWKAGDMIVVAGRPAMGKTALLLKFAHTAASRGHRVLIISAEMGKGPLVERLLSARSGIDGQTLRHGVQNRHDWASVQRESNHIAGLPINLVAGKYAIGEIDSIIRTYKPDLFFVDYLQLLQVRRRDSREQEVAEVSRRIKAIAQQTEAAAITAAQLNRQLEYRSDRRPRLADLRESGQIEQDADVILGLYRHIIYDETADPAEAEILLLKHRNGPTGRVSARFNPRTTSWYQEEVPI